MKNINLLIRFLLELSALAALAYWGYTTGSGALRWLLAIGAPVALAVVWGLLVSPRAKPSSGTSRRDALTGSGPWRPKAVLGVPRIAQLAIEFGLLGAAALALAAAGQPELAVVFAALALVSGTLNYLWWK